MPDTGYKLVSNTDTDADLCYKVGLILINTLEEKKEGSKDIVERASSPS